MIFFNIRRGLKPNNHIENPGIDFSTHKCERLNNWGLVTEFDQVPWATNNVNHNPNNLMHDLLEFELYFCWKLHSLFRYRISQIEAKNCSKLELICTGQNIFEWRICRLICSNTVNKLTILIYARFNCICTHEYT